MALTNLLSVQVTDADGKVKTMPLYFASTTTLAELQGYADDMLPLLDAVIDGKITQATVTLQLTLVGGLKGSAVDGNRVREGALLRFPADNTIYKHGIFVPSWKNTGFAGDVVLQTGAYNTFQATISAGAGDPVIEVTDEYGNDLNAILSGERRFRK